MIEVKNFFALRRFAPDKLQKLNLFETERFFCDIYCLEPGQEQKAHAQDRKSTRLNSSHIQKSRMPSSA